jgi:hypothetical protein
VARLVLGQYRHAQSILNKSSGAAPRSSDAMIDAAVQKLGPPASDPLRWQRDGWVFQLISWIALHHRGESLVSIPHYQPADKGVDAIAIQLVKSQVAVVLICEDKATENPRSTFTSQVVPELQKLEKGERDTHILAETTALLERSRIKDVDGALEKIHWEAVRCYRTTISVSEDDAPAHAALYKGYDSVVSGGVERRQGDSILVADLRAWMDRFCALVCHELNGIKNGTRR